MSGENLNNRGEIETGAGTRPVSLCCATARGPAGEVGSSASAGAEVSIGGEMRPGRIVLTWESDDDGKLIEHEPGAS